MPDAELTAPTVENVRVVVRVRPMDQREKLEGAYNCVSVDGVHNTIAVTRNNVTPPEPPRVYAYDAVFDYNTSQELCKIPTVEKRAERLIGDSDLVEAKLQSLDNKDYENLKI